MSLILGTPPQPSGPWWSGSLDIWPDAEQLVVAWLTQVMPDVNVRTETDTTFGPQSPTPSMRLPLVLVQAVTAGADETQRITQVMNVDVASYGATRAAAWALYHRTHAWMLRALGQSTTFGAFDDVRLHDSLGIVPDSNPALRRVIATYGIAARPTTTV